jgi:hypothetical protein
MNMLVVKFDENKLGFKKLRQLVDEEKSKGTTDKFGRIEK